MSVKEVVVREGTSNGGYQFSVLESPGQAQYNIVQLKKFELDEYVYWHGYIKAKEIKDIKFPLDANPRKPQPSVVTKRMMATIQKHPKMFHHLNNGITIICESCDLNETDGIVDIKFGEVLNNHGDGICNGGHTYYSIEQYSGIISDDCLVRIEIIELPNSISPEERSQTIKEIAEARNAHNQLKSSTSANFSGFYEPFKTQLGENSIFVRWLEGDPDAICNAEDVKNFIAMISAVSPHWSSHILTGNDGNHKTAARGPGSRHDKWMSIAANDSDDANMYFMIPLLSDILLVRDQIAHSLLTEKWKTVSPKFGVTRFAQYLKESGERELFYLKDDNGKSVKGYNLAHTFGTMMVGAFRENVWFSNSDNGVNLVGWLVNPIDLWNKHKADKLKRLNNIALTNIYIDYIK